MLPTTIESLLKIGLLIGCLMGATSYLVLLERWVAAWIQDRRGPNRVGIPLTKIRIFGLGQPIADGGKFIFKEEFTPGHVDKFLYFLAPVIILVGSLSVFAVVPFGSVLPAELGATVAEWGEKLPEPVGPWVSQWGTQHIDEPVNLVAAPGLDVGVIYLFAVGGITVYGAVLGGWSSNNKYSFFGGLRSSAQLISYELPLGLGILGVVLVAGSLRLDVIINQQAADSGTWNVFVQPLGFLVFFVAAFAESGRLPFDMVEAEQELVSGYHTEYSGIKLMMYMVAEFLHMIVAAFLMVILFFGGWHLWGVTGPVDDPNWVQAILRVIVLLAKILAVILFFMIARWSWPRLRFDQLMAMAWKVMLPLGLVNLVVVAAWTEYGDLSDPVSMAVLGWIVLLVSWVVVMLLVPTSCDNRPRRDLSVPSFETEEAPSR